jgi:hypothetical protein
LRGGVRITNEAVMRWRENVEKKKVEMKKEKQRGEILRN